MLYYPGTIVKPSEFICPLLNRARLEENHDHVFYRKVEWNIEECRENTTPFFTEEINPATGLLPFQARKIAFKLGVVGDGFLRK